MLTTDEFLKRKFGSQGALRCQCRWNNFRSQPCGLVLFGLVSAKISTSRDFSISRRRSPQKAQCFECRCIGWKLSIPSCEHDSEVLWRLQLQALGQASFIQSSSTGYKIALMLKSRSICFVPVANLPRTHIRIDIESPLGVDWNAFSSFFDLVLVKIGIDDVLGLLRL